jgi:hypothetical protein
MDSQERDHYNPVPFNQPMLSFEQETSVQPSETFGKEVRKEQEGPRNAGT